MKIKKAYIILFLLFCLVSIFFLIKNYFLLTSFIEELFFQVLAFKSDNYFKFILIVSLLNLLYFITPLPILLIVVFNGFVFGNFGFLFSIFFILIGSYLIFIFSQNILKKKISQFKIFEILRLRAEKIQFIKKPKNLIIFLSRYIFPYFLHNIIFGFYGIKITRFLTIIFLAEIPITLAVNNIGKSLNNFVLIKDYRIFDLFFDYKFLVSFIFILSIILLASSIEKIVVKKLKKNKNN